MIRQSTVKKALAVTQAVKERLGQGKSIMQIYCEVGELFFIDERTVRAMVGRKGIYADVP